MVYTSPMKKAWIVTLKGEDLLNCDIATHLNVHHTTVGHIFQNYSKMNDFKHVGHKPGCPLKPTDDDVHCGVCFLAQCCAKNATDLQSNYFSKIMLQTMRARLQEVGLKAMYIVKSLS